MQLKNLNLLVITNRYPHPKDSLVASFIKAQVDSLKNNFNKIFVISIIPFIPPLLSKFPFLNPRWRRDALASDYKYNNVEVHFAKYPTLSFEYSREKRGEKAFKIVNKIIQKYEIKFDLIHAHFLYPAGFVGSRLKEEYNKPFVVTGHGYDVYNLPFRNDKWNEKIRSVLNLADFITTPSKSNQEKLKLLGVESEKICVIYNGFNPKVFRAMPTDVARKELGLPRDKKIILSVGHLEPVKGHEYLIKAMKIIMDKTDDVLCLIVGSGSKERYLKNLISKLNLENNVILAGGRPHSEIPLWMNACDVFVLPSLSEGNPTVMFEALGCGKPFVGTKVGGIPEIITNEKLGILVEPKNVIELASTILKALGKNWDRNYILEYAKQFSWDKIVKQILNIYSRLV